MNVSDHLIERLSAWGVRRIFGYPGDGINGVMDAMGRKDHGIAFVQSHHEELAAFMACAHAKFTSEPGVFLATSGPGAIHLLNGLFDAPIDHQPVLAIVGQQAYSALGGEYQQEVDLPALFKDVASQFVQTVSVPAQLRHVVGRALRIARAPHRALHDPAQRCAGTGRGGHAAARARQRAKRHRHNGARMVPDEAALDATAEILNRGQRVAMLVGAGALHATDEAMAVADRLGAGVAKALLGKAVLPDALPYVTGPSSELMDGCDTLLIVGSNFPYA